MARFGNLRTLLFSFVSLLALAITTSAQTPNPTPQVVMPTQEQPVRVAGQSSLYCAGYIQYQPVPLMPEIVGGQEEQEQRKFSQGDTVFLNAGSKQGIKEGQSFQIIRPRGQVKGVHKQKTGNLGTYVQEIGQLQVIRVMENTAAAQITFNCDQALFGDFVSPIPDREAPVQRAAGDLDRFAAPSGKPTGRLVMARDNRELVTRNDIVYIDLGTEDKVNPGDYLTIYRPLGTGQITHMDNNEGARTRSDGFQSDRYRGGGFSNQASRAQGSHPITSKEVKETRPPMPRKIVGEMVVIDVQTRTATAIITRVAGEVHTGDWVEIQ